MERDLADQSVDLPIADRAEPVDIEQGDPTVPDPHDVLVDEPAQFLVDVLTRGHEKGGQVLLGQANPKAKSVAIRLAVTLAEGDQLVGETGTKGHQPEFAKAVEKIARADREEAQKACGEVGITVELILNRSERDVEKSGEPACPLVVDGAQPPGRARGWLDDPLVQVDRCGQLDVPKNLNILERGPVGFQAQGQYGNDQHAEKRDDCR
jgi:hypothetical protein